MSPILSLPSLVYSDLKKMDDHDVPFLLKILES